jgi:hypothetical protein
MPHTSEADRDQFAVKLEAELRFHPLHHTRSVLVTTTVAAITLQDGEQLADFLRRAKDAMVTVTRNRQPAPQQDSPAATSVSNGASST